MRSCTSSRERLEWLGSRLSPQALKAILSSNSDTLMTQVDALSENVIGLCVLPLSVVPDVLVDGEHICIPMSTEEPSVVAACAHAAKIYGLGNGITTKAPPISYMVGQLIFHKPQDLLLKPLDLETLRLTILKVASTSIPSMLTRGNGLVFVRMNTHDTCYIIEIGLDCVDAMGANVMNTLLEAIKPFILELVDNRLEFLAAIVSNTGEGRVYQAIGVLTADEYSKVKNVSIDQARNTLRRIALLSLVATVDVNRRITHNKGILNGLDAVARACGQDTRAIAVANCNDVPLVQHTFDEDTFTLHSVATIATPVGTVGGSCIYAPGLLILERSGSISANKFSRVLAAVALLQNFAALRALVSEGIQRGHMALHRRKNIATSSGFTDAVLDD
ncbi:Hydroxymethylglutaryl-coenzyme A reductase [Giardia muris]|uniref:hydroxymethylglutaryl-CoA reductase (NADPH) n=1 Tax=Giardia muris TaxID=5742 RepID=A0A4Z1T2A5_GIAMU|nr:Hydroxymethylglutaryl-coenzyme A reductase [Giardia muris]|eukprot:TNJ29788.1 Hydroxymethylglutaryl-coenzyme A reductase [Giardia muris]